jgi:hypothetical protein
MVSRASNRRAYRKGAGDQKEPRANLYDEVTARIVAELEAGRIPWVQPWRGAACVGPSLPRNALTGRSYSGVNVLLLWGAVIANGYPSQSWLTFRQAQEAGGCVIKGERGQTVNNIVRDLARTFSPQLTSQSHVSTSCRGSSAIPGPLRRFVDVVAPLATMTKRAPPMGNANLTSDRRDRSPATASPISAGRLSMTAFARTTDAKSGPREKNAWAQNSRYQLSGGKLSIPLRTIVARPARPNDRR